MRLAILFILFFFSGACALTYEVVWIRLLGLTLSVTVYALTTVLCAFMAGLALGAGVASRFADRLERPLAVFGVVELGVAACGIVIPSVLYNLTPAYVWIQQVLADQGLLFVLMRFALAFVVLLIPTTLMGMTLPLLSRAVIQREDIIGKAAGSLYAVNTFGAVAGTVAAGFVLIPNFGLQATSGYAAALNVSISLLAIWLGRKPMGAAPAEPSDTPSGAIPTAAKLAALAFAISGFTAMGYEVLWTRALEHYTHNSTYAYSAMLATFLAGLGIGSAVASRLVDGLKRPTVALGLTQLGIGASVLVALLFYRQFETLAPAIITSLGGLTSWSRAVALIFAETSLTLLLTTLFFGATFPIVARIVVNTIDQVGARIAFAYTANTAGSILGALLVGFVILPALGVRGAFLLLLLVNLGLGTALIAISARRQESLMAAGASALIAIMAFVMLPANLLEAQFEKRFGALPFYKEEITDTIMVTEDETGERMIRFGDGRGTAGTNTVVEDRMYAHVPLLLHPDPKRILQIGFGVGNTLASVATYDIESAKCIELSPGVAEAAPFFAKTNNDVLENPLVELVINDGRNFLMATDERYDVIRLDPPELHTAGVVNLYTREFYTMARDHLKDDGLFSIWVNMAMTPEDDLKALIRTLGDVFPFISVYHGPAYYSWVMNGSMQPHAPDMRILEKHFARPSVAEDLASIGIGDPYRFLAHFYFANDDARAYANDGGDWLVIDDHTRIDFSVPKSSDAYFGVANVNTNNWLINLMEPGATHDVAGTAFLKKLVRMGKHQKSVMPQLRGLEELGLDPADVAARIEAAKRQRSPHNPTG